MIICKSCDSSGLFIVWLILEASQICTFTASRRALISCSLTFSVLHLYFYPFSVKPKLM